MSKLAQSVEAAVKAAKKAKPPKVAKVKKAKADKPKAGIVVAKPDSPVMSKDFISTAKQADAEIREDISSIARDLTGLGAKFNSFRDHGYHRAIGFENFDQWVDDVAEERGMKHSQIRLAMRINHHLVGVGEGKLPSREVQKMSLQNANLLSSIPPKARTAKVVEAAQNLTEKRFQTEIVLPIMKKAGKLHEVPKGKGVDPTRQVEIVKIGPYHVSKAVGESWEYALEIAKWKVRDDEIDIPVIEKMLEALAADFISAFSTEYEEAMSASAVGAAAESEYVEVPASDQSI